MQSLEAEERRAAFWSASCPIHGSHYPADSDFGARAAVLAGAGAAVASGARWDRAVASAKVVGTAADERYGAVGSEAAAYVTDRVETGAAGVDTDVAPRHMLSLDCQTQSSGG